MKSRRQGQKLLRLLLQFLCLLTYSSDDLGVFSHDDSHLKRNRSKYFVMKIGELRPLLKRESYTWQNEETQSSDYVHSFFLNARRGKPPRFFLQKKKQKTKNYLPSPLFSNLVWAAFNSPFCKCAKMINQEESWGGSGGGVGGAALKVPL